MAIIRRIICQEIFIYNNIIQKILIFNDLVAVNNYII
jgi:hypothetical protein